MSAHFRLSGQGGVRKDGKFLFYPGKNMDVNSSQVKIKYEFFKPFRSKHFSKDGNHAESEKFL